MLEAGCRVGVHFKYILLVMILNPGRGAVFCKPLSPGTGCVLDSVGVLGYPVKGNTTSIWGNWMQGTVPLN